MLVTPPGARAQLSAGGSDNESGPRFGPETPRCTALVPTATSNVSRTSTTVDGLDDLDGHGRIYMRFRSAGGRKVASSNLAAPTVSCGQRAPRRPLNG